MVDNRVNQHDVPFKLELGCGNKDHWREGHLGLDWKDYGQPFVWDMTNGLPFADDSCTEIYASHCFEHIERRQLVQLFNECWRCLRHAGVLWVVVPHMKSESGHILPHLTTFDEGTFEHMTTKFNPDYKVLHERWGYVMNLWETIELVTNERPDIHWKGTPLK